MTRIEFFPAGIDVPPYPLTLTPGAAEKGLYINAPDGGLKLHVGPTVDNVARVMFTSALSPDANDQSTLRVGHIINDTDSLTFMPASAVELFLDGAINAIENSLLGSPSGITNNGSGFVRVTFAAPHNFETGDFVRFSGVSPAGVNGDRNVTVINTTTVDLTVAFTSTGGGGLAWLLARGTGTSTGGTRLTDFDVASVPFNAAAYIGWKLNSTTAAAAGSTNAISSGVYYKKLQAGHTSCEVSYFQGIVRDDTAAGEPHGRAWGMDTGVFGNTAAEAQEMLHGPVFLVNNYTDGTFPTHPTKSNSACMWLYTEKNKGPNAPIGFDTFPLDVGSGFVGIATNSGGASKAYGALAAYQVGQLTAPWGNQTKVLKGFASFDYGLYGFHAGARYSGAAESNPRSFYGESGAPTAEFACGVGTKPKAGIPADGDFVSPFSGLLALDTTNSKLYARVGSTWKSVLLT